MMCLLVTTSEYTLPPPHWTTWTTSRVSKLHTWWGRGKESWRDVSDSSHHKNQEKLLNRAIDMYVLRPNLKLARLT